MAKFTEVTLTNQEILDLDDSLTKVGNIKAKPAFSMAVALNRGILKPFIDAMRESSKAGDEMNEYNVKKNNLIKKYGKEVGEMITVEPEKMAEYEKELAPLKKKFKKVIDAYDAQIKEFNEVILPGKANGGEPVKLHQIPKDIPDGVEGNLLFRLLPLLPDN